MSELSPTKKVAIRMGLFAAGIAFFGPAGGALMACLGDAAPFVKELLEEIEKQSPDTLKKIADGGTNVLKGFWGDRLGDAKSEYDQLKDAKINFHISRAILEIWKQKFLTISKIKNDELSRLDSELYALIDAKTAAISQGLPLDNKLEKEIEDKNYKLQTLKAQKELLEIWANNFEEASKEKSRKLLNEIFAPINDAKDDKLEITFEIIQDDEKAEELLWESLKKHLVKWSDEKIRGWQTTDKNLAEHCKNIWTIDFEKEIKESLFNSLRNGFKEKIITDTNVRDKFFYISFLQIAGLTKQIDKKLDLRFDEIQTEFIRVHFENSRIRFDLSQLFQYLEKQEKQQNSLAKALFSITNKLDDFENFSLADEPPTKEEVIRYLEKVAVDAGQASILKGSDKQIEFDRIRQKVAVSERKEYYAYLGEQYEMMRKNNILPEDFGKSYSRSHFQGSENDENKSQRKIVEWNEKTSKDFPRTIILGDPGYGKTWLLCYEARRIALEEIEKLKKDETEIDDIILPVRVRLSDVASYCPKEKEKIKISEVLAKLASSRGLDLIEEFTVNFQTWTKERINKQTGCVLLLDALDEVPSNAKDGIGKQELINKLESFSKERKNLRILLTSRIVGYFGSPITEAKEVEIVWLEEEQIKEFVNIWFENEPIKKDKFYQVLDNQPQVFALAQIPLMLSLMCRVFDLKTDKEEFPNTKTQIYQECLYGYLNDWEQKDKKNEVDFLDLNDDIEILSEATYLLFKEEKEQFRKTYFFKTLVKIIGDRNEAKKIYERNISKLLINSTVDRDPIMRFLHLTFQEYLTASYLAKTGWEKFVFQEHILYDPRWNEVLQILGGQLSGEEAGKYINKLLEINDDEKMGDIFYRPFTLAMFAAVEAGNKLDESLKEDLILKTLNNFFEPPKHLDSEDFMPIIRRWGKQLSKYVLPKLRNE